MAVRFGDSIVTKDLVLYLNASAQKNYVLSEVEVLVVAGGGGGGTQHGGGGGAGGLIYSSIHPITPGSAITVTVGDGGAGSPSGGSFTRPSGGDGQQSVFSTIIAQGGGGGSSISNPVTPGRPGGSGGGCALAGAGSGSTGTGGLGNSPALSPSQGNYGGAYTGYGGSNNYGGGGGGGGASTSGEYAPQPTGPSWRAGNGGPGLLYSISGASVTYAGGGGGGSHSPFTFGLGGLGGGGNGGLGNNPSPTGNGTPGTINTGGGGGGGGALDATGGNGGSGVVIVRYPGPQKATGGNTITQVGGYTIHTFTTSGTFTPLAAPANTGAVYGLQDLSGNNNTATQSGGVTYSTANGGSLSFDGSDDYVTLSSSQIAPGTGAFTWNFWAKSTRTQQNYSILFSGAGSNTDYGVIALNRDVGNGLLYYAGGFRIQDADISFFGNWIYVSFIGNGGGTGSRTLRLYKNGVQAGSTYTFDYNFTSTTPIIGANHSAFGECMGGNITNVTYYNRALSATEIQQNYNAQRGRFGI